ncbi:MAG: hypothetical protein LAO78_12640 [Acidobacteriia bacterium]|nr:hypothetical protein [Terriglobia bacterium]
MSDKPLLINSKGERIDVDELVGRCREDPNRILADDDVGVVAYVGDMDIFVVTGLGHPETGAPAPDQAGHWVKKVTEVSVVRFGQGVRHQIGSVVQSLAADSVFVIRDGDSLRKVLATDLKPGMVLRTGEKVYW